ncbi:MAG: F0F1 ATP synthase subunit A [Candidatus Sericytochromatia bacterium]
MQPAYAQETHQGSSGSASDSTTTTVPANQSTEHGTLSQNTEMKSQSTGMQGSESNGAESHENAMSAESHSAEGGAGEHGGDHSSYHPPAPYRTTFTGERVPPDVGPDADPGFMSVHLNTLIMTWIVMAVLITMAVVATRKLSKKPDTKQIFFESLVDLPHFVVKSQIAHNTARYVPFIGSLFLFILVSDWLGLIPWRVLELFGTPEGFELASPTNDLNTNGALAMTALASYWFFGISKKGLSHFKHYFSPMWFLFPLNMMEDVSRPLSLSFRLFGNILGGEIVIGILLFLTSAWVVTSVVVLPMFALEVLVGFIQAFIFSMLTASYIGGMVAEHH